MKYLFITWILASASFFVQAAEIPILSTGVSEEERGPHSEYSLKLVFFQQDSGYIANVQVHIYDQANQLILDTLSKGPWLFVELDPGSYSVKAKRQNGEEQGAKFTLDGKGQKSLSICFQMCD